MVFRNQFERKMYPQNHSNREKNQISVERFKELIEKEQKYEDLKKEKEESKEKNDELQQKLDEAQAKIKDLKEQNEKYLNRLQILQADYENYKKRVDRDSANYKRFATEKIVRKLVSHYDDLKRANEIINTLEDDHSIKKGFEMILTNFEKILKEEGIEPMDCEGEKFDPYKHDAMLVREDSDKPENTVLEELEKGYYFNKEVLRPAKVVVSKKLC
ncbi:MAG: nucleotide exchange factor GrpE [Promethearchaeia archaeon]